jgi:hypothetical protein
MKRWLWLLCGLSMALSVSSALAQSATLTLEAYWAKVEATRMLTNELAGSPPETIRARLSVAAEEWAALREITLADGTRLPVETAPLVTVLRRDPPDLNAVRAQLNVLRQLRTEWAAARHTSRDLESLRAILARPEFQWQTAEPSLLERWWQQLRQALNDFLRRLFASLGGGETRVPGLGDGLTVVAVIALALVLLYVVRGLRSGFSADASVEAAHADEVMTAETALQRAQSRSAEGDYRTAIRYLYLGTLLLLDERGLLRYDRSATNREYLRRVADKPHLLTHLREVVEVFDRVWYGYQPVDAAAYATYEGHVAELRRQT